MTRRRLATHSTMVVIAKRYVILSAEHERIRNSPFKRKRIVAHLTAVSPAGSVGASASQRCPPDTHTAMTGYLVFFRLCYLLVQTSSLCSKGFQREVCPFGHSGRSGNPIERVSGGSFPYFCPYRNRVPARHERKRS